MNRTGWICVLVACTLATSASVYGWCRQRVSASNVVVIVAGPDKKADGPTTWPMFGGSPSNLALLACQSQNRRILYGANLPMLIKLAKLRGLSVPEAVEGALQAAHKYINAYQVRTGSDG